ncbi:MAG: flagellin lysine-N-methylase [Fibrobacter sp.]|nr:flagellin lysine-N-methylase [Fibrobacter sp.]
MILRKPDFYSQFKCTASRCSDTCCVGWEIDIDEVSQRAYRKVEGPFGDRLRASIEDGHFKLLPHDRCPFLDKGNLCEIYKNLGEGALCQICREHPRFVEVYGDIMEKGLGLCCEEATRLLLEGKGPLAFTSEECDEPEDELDEDDREIRNQVLYEREQIFSALANSATPFSERLYTAFGITDENPFAPLANARDLYELLAKTVSFGPAWDKALVRIKARIDTAGTAPIEDQGYFNETESSRLLAYLVYRHFAKCLFDGHADGKRHFAVFFWNIVRLFTRELGGKINAIKILSRQLEYCEENMEIVESALDT